MNRNRFLTLIFTALLMSSAWAIDEAKMNHFIDNLMAKMTLQEKIGQLNLPVTGDIITGSSVSGDVVGQIEKGKVGGLFNMKGVASIRSLRKLL